MTVIEQDRMVDLAYQRLSGDSTLSSLVGGNIERAPALPGMAYPFISLGTQSAVPNRVLGGQRIWQNTLLRVTIWVEDVALQGHNLLRQISDRVDTLLELYSGTSGGVLVEKWRQEEVIDSDDTEGDRVYLQRVILYRSECYGT